MWCVWIKTVSLKISSQIQLIPLFLSLPPVQTVTTARPCCWRGSAASAWSWSTTLNRATGKDLTESLNYCCFFALNAHIFTQTHTSAPSKNSAHKKFNMTFSKIEGKKESHDWFSATSFVIQSSVFWFRGSLNINIYTQKTNICCYFRNIDGVWVDSLSMFVISLLFLHPSVFHHVNLCFLHRTSRGQQRSLNQAQCNQCSLSSFLLPLELQFTLFPNCRLYKLQFFTHGAKKGSLLTEYLEIEL